jgi:hypothetical protein
MVVFMTKMLFAVGMIGIVTLFSVPVAPGFASELSASQEPAPFQALSGLPNGRHVELSAMTDEQLAAVEGATFYCSACIKAAKVRHVKLSAQLLLLHRRAAEIQQDVSVQRQRLHQSAISIRQVTVNVKGNNTHQSNTALVFQRN